MFCKSDLLVKKIQEDFLVTYAKIVNELLIKGTVGSLTICKIYPTLFIVVEGKESASVKIVNLD